MFSEFWFASTIAGIAPLHQSLAAVSGEMPVDAADLICVFGVAVY
jgi:hypothetical protein